MCKSALDPECNLDQNTASLVCRYGVDAASASAWWSMSFFEALLKAGV